MSPVSTVVSAAKDSSVTVRLPGALKSRIVEIALETDRSLSNTVLWLLKRGIDAYDADGVLVGTRSERYLGDTVKEDKKARR